MVKDVLDRERAHCLSENEIKHLTALYDRLVNYPRGAMTESITVDERGIAVRKTVTDGDGSLPAVRFTCATDREEPVRFRMLEHLPDGLDLCDVGFHADYGRDRWRAVDGDLVYEDVLEPDERIETVYVVRDRSISAGELALEPMVERVEDFDGKPTNDEGTERPSEASQDLRLEEPPSSRVVQSDGGCVSANTSPFASAFDGETFDELLAEYEPVSRGEVVDALIDELRSSDSENAEALCDLLGRSAPNHLRMRIERTESKVAELDAYTDALREFIDDEGTAERILDDVESVIEELDDRIGQLESQHADVEAVEARVDEFATEMEALCSRLDTVDDRAREANDRSESLATRTETVTTRTETLAARTEKLDSRTENLDSRTESLENRTLGTEERTDAIEERTDRLVDDVDSIDNRTDSLASKIRTIDDRTDELATRTIDVDERIDDVESDVVSVVKSIDALEEKSNRHGDSIEAMQSAFDRIERRQRRLLETLRTAPDPDSVTKDDESAVVVPDVDSPAIQE